MIYFIIQSFLGIIFLFFNGIKFYIGKWVKNEIVQMKLRLVIAIKWGLFPVHFRLREAFR